jgi:hypothetical protein
MINTNRQKLMLWKQRRLNYLLKSPFIYLSLTGCTKAKGAGINFYLINVPTRIYLLVKERSNCDRRVAEGEVVNGRSLNEGSCLIILVLMCVDYNRRQF